MGASNFCYHFYNCNLPLEEKHPYKYFWRYNNLYGFNQGDVNSWNFTKLGKVEDVTQDELKQILGKGDVTAVFSVI